MRLLFATLVACLLLVSNPAAAQTWSTTAGTDTFTSTQQTFYSYDFTDTTASDGQWVGNCDIGVFAAFDPSIGNSNTDASTSIRQCDSSTDVASCIPLAQAPDGTEILPDQAITPSRPWIRVFPSAPPQGGDIARVRLTCYAEATNLVGGAAAPPETMTLPGGVSTKVWPSGCLWVQWTESNALTDTILIDNGGATVKFAFEPSIGNSATDAQVEILSCTRDNGVPDTNACGPMPVIDTTGDGQIDSNVLDGTTAGRRGTLIPLTPAALLGVSPVTALPAAGDTAEFQVCIVQKGQ